MAECLTHGTTTRSLTDLYETAESLGASFGVGGGTHTIRFGAKCLAEDMPVLVDLLADVLRRPAFPMEEIEKVRGEIVTELEDRAFDTRSMADLTYHRLAYPPTHPYSRPSDGHLDTVRLITRSHLVRCYETSVPVRPMILCVVGAVTPEQVRDLVGEHCGDGSDRRTALPPNLPTIPEAHHPRSEHVPIAGKVQIDLVYGVIGPKRRDEDFIAASVANLVLGGFGLMGRLGLRVREEQGLAYYAASRLGGGLGPGPWACIAGVAPQHYHQAVATIERELDTMRSTPVPTDELEDSKAYLTGSLPLKLESNEGMAGTMIEIELHGLGWDYLLGFADRIAAVGSDEVMAVMQRYFKPTCAALASAGPEASG